MKIKITAVIFLAILLFTSCFDKSKSSGRPDSGSVAAPVGSVRVYHVSASAGVVASVDASSESSAPGAAAVSTDALFDNNTDTSCTFTDKQSVTVIFSRDIVFDRISIYGNNASSIVIHEKGDSSEVICKSDITGSTNSWSHLEAVNQKDFDEIEIEFSGTGSFSIGEIAFWEKSDPVYSDLIVNKEIASMSVDSSDKELYPGRIISLSPDEFSFTDEKGEFSAEFALGVQPDVFKRAYLVFEGYNLFRAATLAKSINGLSWTGGMEVTYSGDLSYWKEFYEEINPAWLKAGANKIQIKAAAGIE